MIVSGGQTLGISPAARNSLSDETPLLTGGSYYSKTTLALSGGWLAYSEMYKSQPWVFTLVRKLSTAGARLPLIVHQRADDGSRPPLFNTDYGNLLETPSTVLDPHLFWLWVMSTIELYGEAILWKWRDDRGQVRDLFPLHPTNITIRRGEDGGTEYIYMPGMRTGSPLPPIPEADIIHFKTYNPATTVRGLSWLEPLRQTLLTDDASRRAQAAQWRNGARPSVVLQAPNALSDAAIARVRSGWNALHSGVDNWAKTVILEEGMTVQPFSANAVDMQYIQSRQLSREECCAVADVPPPVVHILDRATFSNITEQMRSMYRDTMVPRLRLVESVLDHQLRPEFDPIIGGTMRAAFDMSDVLSGNPEAQTESDAKAIETGQMTPNEARARRHLAPHPDGERLFIMSTLIPLGTERDTAPTGTDVVVHPQAIKAYDRRAAMSRLGRVAGYVEKSVILDGLSEDLASALAGVGPVVRVEELKDAIKALEPA